MKLLLLTGIQDEIFPLIPEFQLTLRARGLYQSKRYPEFFVADTGPGLQKHRELRELLKDLLPDLIVNAGLASMLQDNLPVRPGDLIGISSIIHAELQLEFPIRPHGHRIVSISKQAIDQLEKSKLSRDHAAQFCDTEAALLVQLVRKIEELREETALVFCKVVGDTLDHYDLYENDNLVREWEDANFASRMLIGFKFPGGPLKMKRLLDLKQLALANLTRHTTSMVKALLGGAEPEKFGSFYAPA